MNDRTCVHFNGIQNATCEAGVRYADVTVDSPYRNGLPCLPHLRNAPPAKTCDKFRYPTAEEIAADRAELEKALAAINAGRSPCCDAPLDESQVRNGTGPRFCSKCATFVFRGCRSAR